MERKERIEIEDRKNETESIIKSKGIDPDRHFIEIKVLIITSLRSPLHASYGAHVSIAVADLSVNYDTSILHNLRPYFLLIQKEIVALVPSSPPPPSSISVEKESKHKSVTAAVDNAINRKSLNGLELKAKVGSFTVNLLYHTDDDNGGFILDKFFTVEILKLDCLVQIKESCAGTATLHLLEVLDTRPTSQYYVYNTLLTKTYKRSTQAKSSDFLTIKFHETTDKTNEVELVLKDLTSHISVDAIMDIAFLVGEYVKSGVAFALPADQPVMRLDLDGPDSPHGE